MKKLMLFLALVALVTAPAIAQSSGNFAAEINTTECVMDQSFSTTSGGTFSGGIKTGNFPWITTIKVPNGSGTSLIIRPSFAVGLYTKVKLSSGDTSSTAIAGLKVCVDLDAGLVNNQTAPHCVYYNKRFLQLSSNLFTTLLADCDPVADGIQPCELQLVESTLSAHSFDFVGHSIPGGTRTVTVSIVVTDLNTSNADAAVCIGPGVVTVTQTKVFSTSSGIDTSTP